MTNPPDQQPPLPNAPMPTTPPSTNEKNTLGTAALIAAIIGFVFACIPGALIVGWILLPIAFVLSIVAIAQRGKRKTGALTALILSIVGTIVGVIVFLVVLGGAIDEAFSDEVTAGTPAATQAAEDGADDADGPSDSSDDDVPADSPAGEEGSRANPYPIGTELSSSEWTVVINGVDLDATEAVLAENEFNDPPEDGNLYILVNLTVSYTGDDPEGSIPWTTIAYVTAGGNTINTFDSFAVAPDSFDEMGTLYEGASTTGNKVLEVPADGVSDGVLEVRVDMLADKVFVAVD